MLVTDH